MKSPLLQRSLAEFIGTFLLVLIGCGSVVVNFRSDSLTLVGIAAAWGIIVMVMIYAIGGISGAHINPAVTIAFTAAKRLPIRDALAYVPAQCAGGIAGASAIMMVLGNNGSFLGATAIQDELTPMAGFAIEAMMTAILMFIVMGVSTGAKEETITAGIAVGATIAMEVLVAGPLTNASMNPARSLGPAIMSGKTDQLWVYLVAPVTGAIIGCFLHLLISSQQQADQKAG